MTNKQGVISSKLLNSCKKGRRKAQEKLYKQFYSYGISICLRYAYSRDEAVEILNDSFFKVFKNIEQYNPEIPFTAWLRKIIINTSIDYYRKYKKLQSINNIDIQDIELADCNTVEKFNIEDIGLLLNQLPENYRLVFNLYEIDGYKHAEIAQKLNIAESSSRTMLTRAKKILRMAYEEFYKKKYAKVI